MKKISNVTILERITVCPYCMNQRDADYYSGCCGEASTHFAKAFIIYSDKGDEDIVLAKDLLDYLDNVPKLDAEMSKILDEVIDESNKRIEEKWK